MFQQLLTEIIKKLSEHIKKNSALKVIEECIDEIELHSVLRDRIFHSDEKTKEFIDKIRVKFVVEKEIEKLEISETEFGEFLYDCLKKNSEIKNSKTKIISHYFSNEKDLIIKIQMKNKKDTQFRVLVVKT